MDTNFIIAQIFGILGIITSICSMQFKNRKQIFIALLLLNAFSALNFIFLGSLASTYVSLFAIFEMIINHFFEQKKQSVPHIVVAFYAVANVALGLISFSKPLDLLPIAGSLVFCATVLMKKEQNIRKATILNQTFWLIFDLAVGAYMFAISNILTIASTSIALWRFKNKQNKSKKHK